MDSNTTVFPHVTTSDSMFLEHMRCGAKLWMKSGNKEEATFGRELQELLNGATSITISRNESDAENGEGKSA